MDSKSCSRIGVVAYLKTLGVIINNSGLSEQDMIAALYEVTASSLDNRKFFWDLIGWENLEEYVKYR